MLKRLSIVSLSLVATLALLEAVARFGLPFGLLEPRFGYPEQVFEHVRGYVQSGEPPGQVGDAHVIYRSRPGWKDVNRWGGRGPDWEIEKGDALRIACVGGSTTHGMLGRSYPGYLADLLAETNERAIEVQNWGTHGWTTAETLVNYTLRVQDFEPDLVLVHHAVNDVAPRMRAAGFESDYSHLFRPWCPPTFSTWSRAASEWSELWSCWLVRTRGDDVISMFATRPGPGTAPDASVLVEATTAPFRRNVLTLCELVELRGGTPILLTMPMQPPSAEADEVVDWKRLGTQQHNEVLRELARESNRHLVDLARLFADKEADFAGEFTDLVHLTGRGDRYKANLVARYLERQGLL